MAATTIDRTSLTHEAQWTLTQVAFRISLGFSEREAARDLGMTTAAVKGKLESLREELMEQ